MTTYPLAYHITWGTYGTRLRGGDAPYVDRKHNQYGTPLPPPNPAVAHADRDRMKYDPVYLTEEQRSTVRDAVLDVARRYHWHIHTEAANTDHIHVVITAKREGEALRDALKAVACKALNKKFGKREWWAEKGSAKYIWDEAYLQNAIEYVGKQDTLPPIPPA
jgi:REP element-mobilizing transposase RayT